MRIDIRNCSVNATGCRCAADENNNNPNIHIGIQICIASYMCEPH